MPGRPGETGVKTRANVPSSRSRRFLQIAARLALAGAVALVAIVLVLALFTGPLVDYLLGIASRSFNGELRVQDASLGLDGVHFQELKLTDSDGHPILTAPSGVLRVHPLRMVARWHWIGALGDLTLDEPGFQVEIATDGQLNLSRLLPSPRPGKRPLLPEYTGTLRVNDGWIGFQDLRREGFLYRLRAWNGSLAFRRGERARVDFRFVPVQDRPGQIQIKGTLHPLAPKLDLEVLAEDVVAKRLTEHPFVRNLVTVHSGLIDAGVWGRVDVDRWEDAPEQFRYGGRLSLSKGEVRLPGLAPAIRQIEARLDLLTGTLKVKEARGNILGTGFDIHGRVFFPPHGRVDLVATVPRMRSETLAGILNRAVPMTGQGRVDVAVTGPFDALRVAGKLKADKLTVQGQDLRQAEVRFRVDGTLVHLETVRALAGDGVVEGDGYLLLGKETQLALRVSGSDLPLGAVSPIGGRTSDFEFTVVGTARQPVVFGSSGRVDGFQGPGGVVDWVSGRFLYFDGGVVVLDGAAGVRGGEVAIPYAMYDTRDPYLSASVSTTGFDLPVRPLGTLGDFSGQLRGRLQVSGPPTLRGLYAVGVSEGTDLQLGNLAVTDLRGPVGMADLQLLLPGVTGRAAGGSVEAAGSLSLAGGATDLVVSAAGVDVSEMASILNRPLHVLMPGSGEVLFGWQTAGRGEPAWFTAAVTSPGGEGYGPWSAAGYGFASPAGLGAVAWVDEVPLEPRRLTRTLDLNGTVTGEIGAWGRVHDVHFAYNAGLRGSEVTGVRDDLILGVGEGRIQGPWVHLGENRLTWQYENRDDRAASLPGLDGAAIPWYGPVLAGRLEEDPVADPPLPPGGAVAVTGSFRMGQPPDYNIRYHATGVDLAWLGAQKWVPEAGDVMRSLNITTGVADSSGTVFADAGLPRLARDSWIEAPWLVVGLEGSPRGPQVFSAVGNVWMGPTTGHRPGAIHLDPLVVSRTPYDHELPTVAELDRADRRALAHEGLMVLQGWVRAPELDLHVSGQGWDVSDALAFAPVAAEFPSDIMTGSLQVENLQVKGRLSKDFLSSLDITGDLAMVNGFVQVEGFPVPVQRLSVSVSQRQRQLLLTDLSLDSGPLHMEGSGSRSSAGRWQADLWAHEFPMSYLHYLGPPYTRLTGGGRMALFLDSGTREPSLYVGFEGREMAWRSEPTAVEFPRVQLGRLREADDGSLRTGPALGVRFWMAPLGLALEAPPGAIDVEARLAGASESTRLSAEGIVEFTPDFEGGPRAWFAGPGGPDFGVAASPFRVDVRDLRLSLLRAMAGLSPVERRFTYSGTLSLLGQWWRDHAVAASGGGPDFRMAVSRLELGEGSGETWTGLSLTDPFQIRYAREPQYGRLEVEPFTFVPHGGGSGSLDGQAEVVLTRAPDARDVPENRVEVRGRDLDPASLDFLVPGAARLGRLEELALLATGPLMTPDLQMAVRMADGQIGPLQVASLNATVQGGRVGEDGAYDLRIVGPGGGPARLSLGAQENPDQVVEISGTLPLLIRRTRQVASEGRLVPVWSGYDVESGGEMHLLAAMTDNQLRLLDELVPAVSQTSGTLRGSLELSGTLGRPELAGSVSVENGAFTHEMAGRITGLNIRTRFEEIPADEAQPTLGYVPEGDIVSRLSIEQFDGLLGKQPFTVAGSAELAGVEPINVAVNLRGERLPLQWGDLFSGTADVALDLLARPGRLAGQEATTLIPLVTGSVHVLQGDVTVPLSGLGGEGGDAPGFPRIPIDYRVNLSLGDDVWVHLLGSRIRAQGDLRLFADPDTQEPVLSGAVDLSRGVLSLPFYDVSFRVRQGRAVFESSRIPTLENVEAETEFLGYHVTAYVNGTYPDLRFELVSNPPLAQPSIQRMLAGAGMGTTSGGQSELAGQPGMELPVGGLAAGSSLSLVSQLLTTPISREIGRLLFLSDFSFEFIPPYNFIIKIAKALDDKDRFLLTLTRVMRGGAGTNSAQGLDDTLYGLEWRFQTNLMMRVAFDQFGQLRYWVQGLWEF